MSPRIIIVSSGATFTLPAVAPVGQLLTILQDCSTHLYVFDGCRWLLQSAHGWAPDPKKDNLIKAYDRAMGVL